MNPITRTANALAAVWRQHQQLPPVLRLYVMAPITAVLMAVLGFGFTLPPGPLCDEGMVLFMEGGCDWGLSNVFFHTKLALLIVLNAALFIGWNARVTALAFLPHFALAAQTAWGARSGGVCDTYYSHPNGSEGQMLIELMAFAMLGLAMHRRFFGLPVKYLPFIAAGWNALYIAAFYMALIVFDHWTWAHTGAVCASMLVVAVLLVRSASTQSARATVPSCATG